MQVQDVIAVQVREDMVTTLNGPHRPDRHTCDCGFARVRTRAYNGLMVLSSQEESLISVIRTLPPDEAGKVLNWARQLTALAEGQAMEWSDSWSAADLADVTTAALVSFENGERDNP